MSCLTHDSIRPTLPSEAPFNKEAGHKDWLYLTLHLENGEGLLFNVDTGAPITVLDKSLEPRLGNRIEERTIHYAWKDVCAGRYKAPKLFLGDTELVTGDYVWTDDLNQNPAATNTTGHPVKGVLGMDCLRHYCLQLDFSTSRARFLDPESADRQGLGRAFPLTVYPPGLSGYVTIHENFTGTRGVRPLLDTGCLVDGTLDPKEFDLELQEGRPIWTNHVMEPGGLEHRTAIVPRVLFGGRTYTNLVFDQAPAMISQGHTNYINAIGLPFLARHLVTLNFPKSTMYLKRSDRAEN